ncbi:MAG TPA: DUF1549 and DUF1553 domain-containing protein [Pirellulaceae bacterium]|nr:DUF1549 and DUF1553 domain-containing protein [Pirellulaceae bacterium]
MCWLAGVVCLISGAARADERLVVLPAKVELQTIEARQRLIVERQVDDRFHGQVVEPILWTSSNEKVVKVVDQVALPVADGTAKLTGNIGERSVEVDAVVSGQTQPHVWSFRNHVESVLSKSGCNGGACHGARAGKNGFRLTLFSYEADADYSYLTRQANGRRIVPGDPGRSLLLTKPTGMIPHKGGVRFEPDSLEYRVLAEWIAQGTPPPRDDDPRMVELTVLPSASRQSIGAKQQLIVQARFSNGKVEDVTRWAKYTSVNTSVASAGDHGLVEVTGAGEGFIKVWYQNSNVMASLSVPYATPLDAATFAKVERRNFIDDEINRKLESLNIPPSPLCDDATFLRRAYLDAIGVLPTADEARAFLADGATDKRERLIDQLLARPEFVDYWTYKWSDLLLLSGERLRPKALQAYYDWIRGHVAANTPWDKFARELVTATGSTHENGATNYYALHQDPEDMAETVAQAFLGLSINCARCHNHPLEKWTNDQYYGFANMFSRVRSKGWGGDFRNGDGGRVVFSDTQGELIQPSKGRPQPPRPLDAPPLPMDATADRRVYLAEWLTSPKNPYFTRTIVNRVWANFFGTGLVEKVDDIRITNPPSNERLMAAAATHLVENRFDLKELMRAILRSAAYQRSSQSLPGNAADERFYSRYYPRRLKAEVLLDAVSIVTAMPSEFKGPDNKPYPKGTRALQLPDANVDSYFLKTFGRPERLITCECERSDEPSMTQVLHLANGGTLNGKLQTQGNRIDQLVMAGAADAAIVDELYLAALSRQPTESERKRIVELLATTPAAERRVALEDLFWSVLSSREFLFNH